MIKVTLKDGSVKELESACSVFDVAKEISSRLAKAACVAKIDGEIKDLRTVIDSDCTLEILTFDDEDGKKAFRHTASHILAQAVKRLYPEVKLAIGPAIDNGFYYDFDKDTPFMPEDLEAIEAEMKKIVKEDLKLEQFEMAPADAIKYLKEIDEPYKVELCEEHAGKNEPISFYKQGEFTDLCAGPHLMSTGYVKAFKLTSCTGAYWRGSEKNKMLSRIYATAFPKASELEAYLNMIEEAKKRDHRKLGKELELFTIMDEGPGFPFFLPKGMTLKNTLIDYWRQIHTRDGYVEISTPIMLNRQLWETSGHWDHYKENMYTTVIDDTEFAIKPMNCPGGILVYKSKPRSYRDLPIRMGELGLVHRHEKSGALHGLMRVRCFTQDDAHILCTPEQLESEIINVIRLIQDLMTLFDFKYKIEISTRPEDSIGTDEAWELATNALIEAVRKEGLPYSINEGDGAFYGPKIDVKLLDCIGREWQCSTIQVDFTLPERFNLTYVGQDGERHRPVMVHRAIMGSVERFIGVLIEQYAGALPVWLAPEQARLLTVTDAAIDAARDMEKTFAANGIRVSLDDRNEKLGFKVREAQVNKIPYMLVVGEKEAQSGTVSVRLRTGENLGMKTVEETIELIRAAAAEPFTKGGMSYSFA